MATRRPLGSITRGTTNPNRLRRVDRWLVATQRRRLMTGADAPFVVDLGHGASGVTTAEWAARIHAVRPDAQVVGLEIDPARVATARAWRRERLDFRLGGFEVPLPDGAPARVIRAFNVLRQYDEDEVGPAWHTLSGRLDPDGIVIDGTCDELGRLGSWIALDRSGPVSLTLSWRLRDLGPERLPSVVAERLPKALIHRNVPGERVHRLLETIDRAWRRAYPLSAYGARQQAAAAMAEVAAEVPVIGRVDRWRLGELTVPWEVVAPASGPLSGVSSP